MMSWKKNFQRCHLISFQILIWANSCKLTSCFSLVRNNCAQKGITTKLSPWLPNTRLYLSSTSPSEDENDDIDSGTEEEDNFMASLRKRMDQVNDRASKLPLVVLDSMLPRQVLKVQVQNPVFKELIRSRLVEEEPRFGILGMAKLATGELVHLKNGVEVQIIGKPKIIPNESIESKEDGILVEFKAGRRFRIVEGVENVPGGWTEARVEFLDSSEEEAKEEKMSEDRMSLARAIAKARAFTHTNTMYTEEKDMLLVERWTELAKENEREKGQIDRLLNDLGKIPPSEQPSERAFWIGALINPIPALGVALEIRPALLTADKAEERVQIALDGIIRSIKHMDGTKRMW